MTKTVFQLVSVLVYATTNGDRFVRIFDNPEMTEAVRKEMDEAGISCIHLRAVPVE